MNKCFERLYNGIVKENMACGAIGLALTFRIYHDRKTINVDELNRMKG